MSCSNTKSVGVSVKTGWRLLGIVRTYGNHLIDEWEDLAVK